MGNQRGPGSGSSSRGARFNAALRMFPHRGGIILGNSVDSRSGKVRKASIELEDGVPVIKLSVEQQGRIQDCRFEEATSAELWCAYNYVNPNPTLRRQFQIDEKEHGLVGKSGDLADGSGWKFGIHPAIAGTLIARDAMRLDMLLVADKQAFASLPEFDTYQWFDEPAVFIATDGSLNIQASSEPKDILLRIRFWTNGLPAWIRSRATVEIDLLNESLKRLEKEAGAGAQFLSEARQEALAAKIVEQLTSELASASGANVPYAGGILVKKVRSDFDGFRRIERFARAVAVLHWIADTCPTGLPALPSGIQAKRFEIQAEMKTTEVRLSRTVGRVR